MYRIFTEDVHRERIEELVSAHFDGFTLIPAIGFWKGARESSLIIEIETDDVVSVRELADSIKFANAQESVLIQHIVSEPEFV